MTDGLKNNFERAGLNELIYTVRGIDVRQVDRQTVQILFVTDCYGSGRQGCGFTHTAQFTVFGNGWIDVQNEIVPYGPVPTLPKIGVQMMLSGANTLFTCWVGGRTKTIVIGCKAPISVCIRGWCPNSMKNMSAHRKTAIRPMSAGRR